MTNEFISTGIISLVVIASRVISHFEHKRTGKDIMEIKISINGELERRVSEANEKGRQEGRDEIINSKNK